MVRDITYLLMQSIVQLLDICNILLDLPLCLFTDSVFNAFDFLLFLAYHLSSEIISRAGEGASEHF